MKTCRNCNSELPISMFWKNANKADGLQTQCKDCMKARNTAWRLANPDKTRAYVNVCAGKNREKRRESARTHYQENLAESRARGRTSAASRKPQIAEYARKRRASDPVFALRGRISAGLRSALATGKGGGKSSDLLGYEIIELRTHLERQFTGGMNWQNMGEWHIDHITPLASFTITDADDPKLRRAWALPNLRPLWAAENIAKGCKRAVLL